MDNIKEKLGEYRKKFYAEKKKVDELEREKSNLESRLETLDKEIKSNVKEGMKDGEDDDNYAYYLKQELMYDYDLLVHMKGEMDEMVSLMESGALI